MKIGIDISPLENGRSNQHSVRGSGFYIKHLISALQKYFPEHSYEFYKDNKVEALQVDVMHYPYFEPFFLTLPRNAHHNAIVTVHDLTPIVFPEHFPSGIRGKLKWYLQKNSLQRYHIITDSEASKKDIQKLVGISDTAIHVIYLAADEQFSKLANYEDSWKAVQKKYSLPEKYILYVGDATWNKNLPRLIAAATKTKLPLIMVGKALAEASIDPNNGWNKDIITVRDMAAKSADVQLIGFVPTDDLVVIYNKATVFAMPSLYEGFGLPILEAMNCGSPVVTTHEASLAEVAGDAAYIVDGYSVDSIADGIYQVFTNPSLQKKLSENGSNHAKKFSWEKTAKKTLAVYELLVT
jgi:glycosyltransferase involved in cell wall biosynthesis